MTTAHETTETFTQSINIPEHADRATTPLFEKTRKHLIERDKGCFICGGTAESTGHPLEAHHHPIERCLTEMIDWSESSQIRKDFPSFGWGSFDEANPYTFVDDMNVNGMLLCKFHHIGKDEGVHGLTHPVWVAQRYSKEGYQFSTVEIIHRTSN